MDMSEAVKHSSHIDPYPPEGNTVVKKAVWDELLARTAAYPSMEVFDEIVEQMRKSLSEILGVDVYDAAVPEIKKALEQIINASEPTPTVVASGGSNLLYGGVMSIYAKPGNVYDGRKGRRIVGGDFDGFIVKIPHVKYGQWVSLSEQFPNGTFNDKPIGFTTNDGLNIEYDAQTNAVRIVDDGSDGAATIFVLLQSNSSENPYLTHDSAGKIIFAPTGQYCFGKLDDNLSIVEFIDGGELKTYAKAKNADGELLELQIRKRNHTKQKTRWRKCINITNKSAGVCRVRRMRSTGKRSAWAYFTFYSNTPEKNSLVIKKI
jgi:hypothetical protein